MDWVNFSAEVDPHDQQQQQREMEEEGGEKEMGYYERVASTTGSARAYRISVVSRCGSPYKLQVPSRAPSKMQHSRPTSILKLPPIPASTAE